MVEVIVVLAIIALTFVLFLPSLIRAKHRAQRIQCTGQLKSVGLALRQWGIDNGDKYPMSVSVSSNGVMELVATGYVASVFLVASNELNTPKVLWCPADRDYRAAMNFSNGLANLNVNYFVGLDADETQPQMFLTGDDNLLVNNVAQPAGVVNLQTNTPVAWSTVRHNQQGNVGLADGSVQCFSTNTLRAVIVYTGTNLIRLAFP
jgi:prepilin-type processing-associated H-X9-DG protein